MEKLGGLILAAGLSSRMGDYKPLIDVDGRSMIGRVIDMMRNAGARTIVVVTGHRREELEAHLRDEGVEFVFNPDYATTQQLESLKLGLTALSKRCEQVMISPADVPLVAPQTVKLLMELDGDFVRPLFHGAPGHPVFLKADWIPYIMSYDGLGGLKGAVESNGQMRLISLEVTDEGVVLDNDTKEDLERLFRWHKRNEVI